LTLSRSERTTDAWFNWKNLARRGARLQRGKPLSLRGPHSSTRAAIGLATNGEHLRLSEQCCLQLRERNADQLPAKRFHRRIFPMRLNWLREDFMNQLDVNIARSIQVTEGLRLQFGTDFINALNNVHYQGPNTDITSANFAKITAQNNILRWIQFQMRVTF
jgi:hypothetical protein